MTTATTFAEREYLLPAADAKMVSEEGVTGAPMAINASVNIGRLIDSQPDLHSGRPCLAGTGMTVHAVVLRHMQGMTAEEILEQFPHLDLSRIYAALAYYHANKEQVEADLGADAALYDDLAAKYPFGWTPKRDAP